MAKGNESLENEQEDIKKKLISIIILYGDEGLPLEKVDMEFRSYCGYSIPYKKFGGDTLKSWIMTLPDIYLVNENHKEVLIQNSAKSIHIKKLISQQKSKKSSWYKHERFLPYASDKKLNKSKSLPKDCFIHSSINTSSVNDYERYELFSKLETMMPIFYKHQAIGDDFFLDIAETKMGYYVPEEGPKKCGLCVSKQTVADLTAKVKQSEHLAPRVVVMIGFYDLLLGNTVNKMIYDLQELVTELRKKNTRVTLITLIPSPKMPKSKKLELRLDTFNKAILDYSNSDEFRCNVIDMNKIFQIEMEKYINKDIDRFTKITKKDMYRVFSDYGRKLFISTLKSCLTEQIKSGH